ncbi:protoporphyrinogen oxidase [Bacillus sp. FJAT-47783]|uniref:protoporphyrinogen oxidase n=1 Tax=Bacillus sp. FJAT-47783 TaxID=2922712 RepID=UPI001FAE3FCB|nr:protoporphyrinogen oxidase [Bacillus sp. FJAT-47783]
MKMNQKKKVVIIGGGITGLSTAFYLQKELIEKGLPVEISLIEAKPRLGGKIETVQRDGFVIERGPDSFLERKKSATELISDIGLADELVNNATGQSYVYARDRLNPIPEGSVMGIPTNIRPFITSGLFSLPGKIRAASDFFLPAKQAEGDQSLGQFFRRRLGSEVVDHLIEPLLSGIYAGNIDELSLMATFPQFYEIEQKHRSLILGMKKTMPTNRPKRKKGIFQTVRTGLQSVVETLEGKLEHVQVKKGMKVNELKRAENGYSLLLGDGTTLQADAVVVATSHQALNNLFKENDVDFSYFLNMPATSVATVAMAFPEEGVQLTGNGTGFVISRNSGFTITACTWTHRKWPHTAPKGKALLRAYVGKAGDEAIVEQSDDIIVKTVIEDLQRIMKIKGEPEFSIVTRLKQSMPQYNVGHKEKIQEVKKNVANTYPGIYLTGASFEGLGIPDCIDQGKHAVRDVLQFLNLS